MSVPIGDRTAEIIKAFQQEAVDTAEEIANETETSQTALKTEEEDNASYGSLIKSSRLKPPEKIKTERAERAQESVLIRKDEADGLADGFTRRDGNRQYHLDRDNLSRLLRSLGTEIKEDTGTEEILAHIRQNLMVGGQAPDVSQIDKALEFLLEVLKNKADAEKDPALKAQLQKLFTHLSTVKGQHFQANKANIETAQKIIDVADILIEQTDKSAPETIAHVRDIVNNPQDLSTKFNYYKAKGYTFKEMKQEIDAILTFVGIKFKDAGILPGEMTRLMDETKTLQAILQIFRHFKRGMPLAHSLYAKWGIPFPSNVSFETLSTTFMKMVDERYPSSDKVSQYASSLTNNGNGTLTSEHIKTIMLIILLSLIRDAIREVSPNKVYRSLQHRDDLYLAIIEALEDLEDALEEFEEQEEEEEQEQQSQ